MKNYYGKDILTAEELPKDEKIYFKKDMFGYRIVQPIKREDGSIHWWNLLTGGTRFLVMTILLFLALGLIYVAHEHDVREYKKVVENPCSYCGSQNMLAYLEEKKRNEKPEQDLWINQTLLEGLVIDDENS